MLVSILQITSFSPDPDTVAPSVAPTVTQVVSTRIIPPTWSTVSTSIPVAPTWVHSELSTVSSHPPVVPSVIQSELMTASSYPPTAVSSWTQSEPSTVPSSLPEVSSWTHFELTQFVSTTSRTVSSLHTLIPTSHPSNSSQRIIDNLEEDEALLVTVVPAAVGLVLIVTSVGLICTVISVYWYSKSQRTSDIYTRHYTMYV